MNKNDLKMIAFGDIMLSRKVGDLIQNNGFSFDDKLIDKIIGNDIVFGNLESVLSNKGELGKCEYCFRANPLSIKILKNLLITDVSVANNHMADYGYDAWYQSVNLLNKSNISTVGDYYDSPDPLIKLVNHKILAIYAFDTRIRQLDIGLLKKMIEEIREIVDYIIVSIHWGNEYKHRPENETINLAHYLIDIGVNIILGSHPHFLQTIEKYHGGLIFYSLGNFIFDQTGISQNESMMVQFIFTKQNISVSLIPLRIEHYQPRIATSSERKSTLERLSYWSNKSIKEEISSGIIQI
jgi:gamma-polyglutamate biosynthesis protein CapA